MWPLFTRRLRLTALGVTVFLWLVSATSAARKNTLVSAEGVIVAIQGGLTDTRLVEPASFADLAEIYMVRVDRWSQPRKEKYILIEYIHHTDLIRYGEFDRSRWNFEIRQGSPEEEHKDGCAALRHSKANEAESHMRKAVKQWPKDLAAWSCWANCWKRNRKLMKLTVLVPNLWPLTPITASLPLPSGYFRALGELD